LPRDPFKKLKTYWESACRECKRSIKNRSSDSTIDRLNTYREISNLGSLRVGGKQLGDYCGVIDLSRNSCESDSECGEKGEHAGGARSIQVEGRYEITS